MSIYKEITISETLQENINLPLVFLLRRKTCFFEKHQLTPTAAATTKATTTSTVRKNNALELIQSRKY